METIAQSLAGLAVGAASLFRLSRFPVGFHAHSNARFNARSNAGALVTPERQAAATRAGGGALLLRLAQDWACPELYAHYIKAGSHMLSQETAPNVPAIDKVKGGIHGAHSHVALRVRRLPRVSRYICLCDRLCDRSDCAENCRHGIGRTDWRSNRCQHTAVVAVCRAAQRDGQKTLQAMVDTIRTHRNRAQHICTSCQ